jgi:hypothetical protein
MEIIIKAGRKSYGICVAALAIQQLFYFDFRPVFLPTSLPLPGLALWVYLLSTALIVAGIAIVFEKKGSLMALLLAALFLLLFLFGQVPHLILFNQYGNYLGTWTNALKELAFSGGALVIADSSQAEAILNKSFFVKILEKLIPLGRIFFSITMIIFGVDHFLYVQFVAALVPAWIPGHVFWTYFAGVALISSGIAIITKIQLKLVATLLGIMIFLCFILLHIPRAIADPFGDKGNEVTSVFQALAFSGIAFIVAFTTKPSQQIFNNKSN